VTTTRRARIARKILEAQDICSFELVEADGCALPPFSAGAHIDVRLFLTDAERAHGDRFTPCCSRALSPRLILDL